MIVDARIKVPWRNCAADPAVQLPPGFDKYDTLYGYGRLMNLTSADLITDMRAAGVSASFLMAEHEWGPDPEWNDRCAALVAMHTDLFSCGFASIDPRSGASGLKELKRAYYDLGLRGLVMEPDIVGLSPTDSQCRPFYKLCESLGMPVGIHTGVNFTSDRPIGNGRPVFIDEIACAHPNLPIICHHGGWPWALECIAVAWKHPNVFIDYGAISPRYMAKGGGYGDVVNLMNTVVKFQILFATDWPMMRYERVLDELVHLRLSDDTLEAYTSLNAQRLLERMT